MTREQLLEAQNAYARIEYANEVYNHLMEVSRERTDDPNNTDIVETIIKNRELVIRNFLHYTPEINDEAIRLLRKVTMIVISDGLHAAIDYVLEVLKENEILFNNIGEIRHIYWISVEEDLPPLIENRGVSKAVLVKVRDNMTGIIRTAIDYRFADDSLFRWKSEGLHAEGIFTVTHWMPIPEFEQQEIASEVIAYQQEEEEIKRLIDEYSEKFPQGGIGGPLQINKGEMILSKEECEKIRSAVLENKPEVVEEIVVDHAIEFLSKKIRQ